MMVIDAAKGIEARTLQAVRDLSACATFQSLHSSTRWTVRRRTRSRCSTRYRQHVGARHGRPSPGRSAEPPTFVGTYDIRKRQLSHHRWTPRRSPMTRMIAMGGGARPRARRVAGIRPGELQRRAISPRCLFGSAIQGHRRGTDLLDASGRNTAPHGRARSRRTRGSFRPSEENLTALVFKIQANMDPNHRDRIAFARVCSGASWCAACG